MTKKPKSIAGKFNPEEVEAIEKICDELDINPNQLVREAIAEWMKVMDVTYHQTLTEKKPRGRPKTKRKRGKPRI
ncbi:MAG: hypothetical protein VX209_03495 [Thermoproteota archaeon]|nr:hypothetical protein [Thermoproteota archaeon]